MAPNTTDGPVFSAVSGSARQLFLLLRCIGSQTKAQVQLSQDGLRFTVEDARVMQGMAFLDKGLFTAYNYSPPANGDGNGQEQPEPVQFQIQLSALLETLQIFGSDTSGSGNSAAKDRWSRDNASFNSGVTGSLSRGGPSQAFDKRVLGMPSLCRLGYDGPGAPFSIIMEEAGVVTTCDLTTYEPETYDEIPLRRDQLSQKIIMRATWLEDAITELSSTSPTRLTITASPSAPYFSLSATGPLGSATVEFAKDPELLETFQVSRRTVNSYKFSLIKSASRAMALASKVSIRGDEQGVLSLQFMVEIDNGPVSFIDLRFAPLLPEDGEDEDDDM